MPVKQRGLWPHFIFVLACAFMLALVPAAHAQQEELIAPPAAGDPELESRVRALSYQLRCLVCQNESVAESRAPLAVDLRNQVREQLAAGKSEGEVIDFLVSRYGDFVLYRPPFRASTALLWFGPALLLLAAVSWLILRVRRREATEAPPQLTPEEEARARALLEGRRADSSKESRS